MEEWATRLYEVMTAAGRTQAELARACGLKPGSVSGWFGQGKPTKMISGDNLVTAAAFLNTTAEYIMTGRGPRTGEAGPSHTERPDDATMAQGVELMYLLADARPEDRRLRRPSWAMLQIAGKAVQKAKGDSREAMAEILSALAKET